jgi:hypothetical protein
MADPVLDWLEAESGDTPKPTGPADPVTDFLASGGNATVSKPPAHPAAQAITNRRYASAPMDAVSDVALNLGSSALANAAAGTRALWNLARGSDISTERRKADELVKKMTIEPAEGSPGARVMKMAGSKLNPLNWPGMALQKGGELAQQGLEAAGVPSTVSIPVGAGLEAAGTVGLELAGGRLATKAPKVRPRVEPGLDASPTAVFGDSMGAAAAAPNLQALSPELRTTLETAAREGTVKRDVATRHIEADTLPVKIRLTEGQATQDPVLLSKEQNARGKNPELARVFNEQNQQLIENLDEIRRTSSPNTVWQDHIQNGQTLIDAYKQADAPVRADINAKYQALRDAAGGDFPVDGQEFVRMADKSLEKQLKSEFVPSQIASQLAKFRDGKQMTFENFESLRTNLAAEARKADRAGDGNAAQALSVVREQLENLPLKDGAADLKPLADEARAAAKARFDRLREDPAYRAAVDDDAAVGELSPLADQFVQKYVIKGKQAHIQKMRENLKDLPEANEVIAGGVLNYIKSKSGVNLYTNEGNFSQAGYNRALSEVMPKIDDLLDEATAEQVQKLGAVARYTQAQPRGSFVNNSNTFVSAAADHLASTLEGVANVTAGGIPVGTFARKGLQGRAERNFVRKATAPGAGIQGDKQPAWARQTTNLRDFLQDSGEPPRK